MRLSGLRSTFLLAASFVALNAVACGGAQTEAKVPTTDATDAPRDGSITLDPAASIPTSAPSSHEAATPTAKASSTDDGSDILPPGIGPGAKDSGTKGAAKKPAAPKKKAAGKATRASGVGLRASARHGARH